MVVVGPGREVEGGQDHVTSRPPRRGRGQGTGRRGHLVQGKGRHQVDLLYLLLFCNVIMNIIQFLRIGIDWDYYTSLFSYLILKFVFYKTFKLKVYYFLI